MKKFICSIIILIILSITFLTIREIKINTHEKIDNSMTMSQDDVLELLKKGATYNNYSRTRINNESKEELFYKDGILASYLDSKIQYWMNLSNENKEMILFNNETASIIEDFENIEFSNEFSQLGYYIAIFDTNNFNFEYIGKTTINGRTTIIAKSVSKDNNFSKMELKYYIDELTGVVIKRINTFKFLCITKQTQSFDRGIKFDNVTDEQIRKPNLNDYEIDTSHFPSLEIW
ncbi:MAG: hypothetical protein J6A36_04325 [Clostridia bacterium]|nr:hypothetical protein [Clostridia bacterium]